MSANTNDTNPVITPSNYEEYFLMYVDDELSPQERAMVEAFLQFHPELQSELDLLMGTKLEPELLQFADKEVLFAQNIKDQNVDEDLLLLIDGELDAEKEDKVKQQLATDSDYQKQYQWLLRTKADPQEIIPYPNKAELYRHSVRRLPVAFVLRIAAAVLIIASLGVVYLQQEKGNAPATMAQTPEPKKDQPQTPAGTAKQNDLAQASEGRNNTVETTGDRQQPLEDAPALMARNEVNRKLDKPVAKKAVQDAVPAYNATPDAQEQQLAYEPEMDRREEVNSVQAVSTGKKDSDENVTSIAAQPYTNLDAVPEAKYAVNVEESRERGNIKSLLRRATRLIERRTGINATNENDELLIGVVALKLK